MQRFALAACMLRWYRCAFVAKASALDLASGLALQMFTALRMYSTVDMTVKSLFSMALGLSLGLALKRKVSAVPVTFGSPASV